MNVNNEHLGQFLSPIFFFITKVEGFTDFVNTTIKILCYNIKVVCYNF